MARRTPPPHPQPHDPDNDALAAALEEAALRYAMEGVPFKPRAYQRAAEAVRAQTEPICARWRKGGVAALAAMEGVGDALARHLADLCARGTFPELEALRRRYPIAVRALAQVEGLGPARIRELYERLGVATLEDLERAVRDGSLAALPRMGEKTRRRIAQALALRRRAAGRLLLGEVLPRAEAFAARLRALKGVAAAEVAGSVRRRRETVGDIDILVAGGASCAARVWECVAAFPEVVHIHLRGAVRMSVRLSLGIDMDVRLIDPTRWGAALMYFTGSKAHNIALRTLAEARDMKLSEYGLFEGTRLIAAREEADVYRALKLQYIPPELREGRGEVEAAAQGALPALIPYGAVRGDLQVHTRWSDGTKSVEEMARAAAAEGLEYILITDHTRALAMAGGLDEKALRRQRAEIDRVNETLKKEGVPCTVLQGAEVNIMKDGSLDLSDEALALLDVAGAAVHTHFSLSEEAQTARLLRVVRHPLVDIIFHPTARLIGTRAGIRFDADAVFAACAQSGTYLGIDSQPRRMDLPDTLVRKAAAAGVRFVIDTDAHAPAHFAYRALGEAIARRGWLTARDVANTLPCAAFLAGIKRNRRKKSTP